MPAFNGIHYIDTGATDTKDPVILMLHGFFMDHRLFEHQIDALKATHRCIAVDLHGFGQTQKPTADYSLYDEVNALFALMDHCGVEKFVVMGMSMGGYLALRMALTAPSRILGMVLISTQAGKDNPETVTAYQQLRDNWKIEAVRAAIIENLLPVIIGPSEKDVQTWRPIWNSYDPKAIFYPMNAMTSRDDIDISRLNQPALVIHGADDHGIPLEAAKKMADELVMSEMVVVPGGCHAVNMTHPAPVNQAILSFLDKYHL